MNLRLAGKVAVVTGASKGVGLAVTGALVDEGASVVAAARSLTDDLSQLSAKGRVHPVQVDLGTPDGPARLIDEAIVAYGGLDVLVNNVGAVRPRPDGFLSLTDDDWLWALTISFLAAVRTTRAALPHLLDRGAGTIVSTCSVNAFRTAGHRLQRCQGRPAELLQVALQGGRLQRHPRQHSKSGAGLHPIVAR